MIEKLSDLELYFCDQWAKWNDVSISDVLEEMADNPKKWNDRYNNYKHALLFTIRRGKSGSESTTPVGGPSFNFPDRIYVTYWNWFIARLFCTESMVMP